MITISIPATVKRILGGTDEERKLFTGALTRHYERNIEFVDKVPGAVYQVTFEEAMADMETINAAIVELMYQGADSMWGNPTSAQFGERSTTGSSVGTMTGGVTTTGAATGASAMRRSASPLFLLLRLDPTK